MPDAIHLPHQDVTATTTQPGTVVVNVQDRFCFAEVESGLRDRECVQAVVIVEALYKVATGHMIQLAAAQNNRLHTFRQTQFRASVCGNRIGQQEAATGYQRRLWESQFFVKQQTPSRSSFMSRARSW